MDKLSCSFMSIVNFFKVSGNSNGQRISPKAPANCILYRFDKEIKFYMGLVRKFKYKGQNKKPEVPQFQCHLFPNSTATMWIFLFLTLGGRSEETKGLHLISIFVF